MDFRRWPAPDRFGTGDHATTSTCLRFLVDIAKSRPAGWSCVDLGCGTGVLAIAAKRGWSVESYDDDAEGRLGKNEAGKLALTHVTLRPRIIFAEGKTPDAEALQQLHHQAHENCFIANSVKTEVVIEAQ